MRIPLALMLAFFFLAEKSRNWAVLVLNEGEDTLEVNATRGNF